MFCEYLIGSDPQQIGEEGKETLFCSACMDRAKKNAAAEEGALTTTRGLHDMLHEKKFKHGKLAEIKIHVYRVFSMYCS